MMLHVDDLVFRYHENGKRNICDHTSLDIREGGITVLMGASGCGKSTLVGVLAGLYPENGGYVERGTVELFGRPVADMSPQARARLLTLMFQNPDLQFCMDTLRNEMRFCMENLQLPPGEMDGRIEETAKTLHVEALLDAKLHTLSGGEKQKAALACLFVMDSRCIVLDEAFANLDAGAVRELMALLRLMKRRGRSIIAIDHRLSHWLDDADEIILLGEGCRVLRQGIHRDNLEAFLPELRREGLFLPPADACPAPPKDAPDAIVLKDVSVPKGVVPKKRLFKAAPAPEYLLEHANATFPRGCMTAILGPSGSGKTTTFLSILKQHPFEGEILIDGVPLSSVPERALWAKLGIVFQNPENQFITQNVLDEVKSSLRIWDKGADEEACERAALAHLDAYGLGALKRYSPYMLSQGQQRRLAVLSVLCGGQKILLLDEPTYGQDDRAIRAMMAQLHDKIRREGLTVVFITHDADVARSLAHKIYVLKDRQLVCVPPEALEEGYAH